MFEYQNYTSHHSQHQYHHLHHNQNNNNFYYQSTTQHFQPYNDRCFEKVYNNHMVPWCTPPPTPEYYYNYTQESCISSSSRQIRNQAEKQRRDKLNQLITELSILVPLVACSAKKLDKTSILRLSASYLRMHQVIKSVKDDRVNELVELPLKWCQRVLDIFGGVILIVSSSGKIVFVSNQIEGLLGYQPNDLLGTSLYTITSSESREVLKRNLKADMDPRDVPSTSTEDNSLCFEGFSKLRRSFLLRLQHRVVSKSDQPKYEDVHIEGYLRVPSFSGSTKKQKGEHVNNDNVVLIAVLKPCIEKRITAHSILEATKDEWISRHLVDGTIVYSDHRISVVSGYMPQDVSGQKAFLYMHSDDARWVMIALRQMYLQPGESYGSSCYRLLSKPGQFIYIRTHGYLELNDENTVQSFICINSLVTREEGEKLIAQMKSMVKDLVKQAIEPGTSALAEVSAITDGRASDNTPVVPPLKVEDPNELQTAIEKLLTEVPSVEFVSPHSPGPDQQFEKIAMKSKNMPPVISQSSEIGVVNVPCLKKSPKYYNRTPVITSVSRFKDNTKRAVSNEGQVSVIKRIRPEGASVIESEYPVIRSVSREDTEALHPTTCHAHERPSSHHTRNVISTNHFFLFESDHLPIQGSVDRSHDGASHLVEVDVPSHLVEVEVPTEQGLDLWEADNCDLDKRVVRGHLQLESTIQNQERQIFAIQNDLSSVPVTNTGSQLYHSRIKHLKAEHIRQTQILKDLQEDHQKIQHINEQMNVS